MSNRPSHPPPPHFQPIRLPRWKHGTSLHNDKAQRHLSRLFFLSCGWKFAATHYRLLVSPDILPVCLCLKCTFSFSLCLFISLFPPLWDGLSQPPYWHLLIDIPNRWEGVRGDAMWCNVQTASGAVGCRAELHHLLLILPTFPTYSNKQYLLHSWLRIPGSRGTV